MKAIHGGQATHDTLASQKMAVLLRGGLRPQASVSPAARRATGDLWRRRTHLRRNRAELFSHGHKTTSQDTLPAIGKNIAYQAHREGVANRVEARAVPTTLEVDLALTTYDEARLTDLARFLLKTAQPHDPPTLSRLHTVPGVGKMLSLVWRDELHAIHRVPGVQDFAS
jgi:hypothetical protein